MLVPHARGARAMKDKPTPLGPWSLAALLLASIIGTGVFTTSGIAVAEVGSPTLVMWAWVLGGVYALLGVTVYWNVAKQIGDTGGEYALVRSALHPTLGFLCGAISLFSGFAGPIAVSALALDRYVQEGVGPLFMLFHFGLLITSPRASITTQNFAVYLRLAALGTCLFLGLTVLTREVSAQTGVLALQILSTNEFSNQAGTLPWMAFANVFVWVLFSYSGWSSFAYVWDRFDSKALSSRFAVGSAVVVVTLLYLALNFLFLFLIPTDRIWAQEHLAVVAADCLAGDDAAQVVRIIVVTGFVTSMGALVYMGVQVVARIMKDWTLWNHSVREQRAQIILLFIAGALYLNASVADALGLIGYLLCLCNVLVGLSVYKTGIAGSPLYQRWTRWCLVPVFIVLSALACILPLLKDPKALLFCSTFVALALVIGHFVGRGRAPSTREVN